MNSMKDFFNFKEQPFKMVPISENFFESDGFSKTTQSFLQYLSSDMPFFQIIGDNGTGKSSFIKKAVSLLDSSYRTSVIAYRGLSSFELLLKIADDFKIEYPENIDEYRLFQLILLFINTLPTRREKAILFIDDAETFSIKTFESIVSLADSTTPNSLKIVILANENFRKVLDNQKLISFTQRTFANAELSNLEPTNIRKFINFQIKHSGSPNLAVSTQVISKVSKLSKGNPRLINLLMEKSMISAYIDNSPMITVKHLNKALLTTNTIRTYLNKFLYCYGSKRLSIIMLIIIFIFAIDIIFNHILSDTFKVNIKNILNSSDNITVEKKPAPFAKDLFVNDDTVILVEADDNSSTQDNRSIDNITDNKTLSPVKVETPTKPAKSIVANEKIVTVTASSLNIRSEPSTTSSILASVKSGNRVTVVRDDGEWIYIKHNNINGYIMKQYTDMK